MLNKRKIFCIPENALGKHRKGGIFSGSDLLAVGVWKWNGKCLVK